MLKPLRTLLAEAIADVASWDARLHRTVKRLVAHPGLLTNEYLLGRRTRYVAPFRLYLGASVVYFTVFLATGSSRFFIFWTAGLDTEFSGFLRLLPKLMFLMLPVFAALVAVLFRRRHRLYAAHLVFALHFHAFAFLVLPLVSLLQLVVQPLAIDGNLGVIGTASLILSTAVELWVIAHLFFALRRVYADPPLLTIVKTAALFVAYMFTLAAVGALLLPAVRNQIWNAIVTGS